MPEAWNAFDATDHRDGYHGTTFYFNPTCTAPLNGRHRCQILVSHAGGAQSLGDRWSEHFAHHFLGDCAVIEALICWPSIDGAAPSAPTATCAFWAWIAAVMSPGVRR